MGCRRLSTARVLWKSSALFWDDRNHKDVQLSKSLSWLLRHGAIKEGLCISPEGYVNVTQILQHKLFRGKYNKSDIERVVINNEKQRYKLRTNSHTQALEIKANQGHTIAQVTDVDLTPILQPIYETVLHGTYLHNWPQIKTLGLSCMKRRHIHLAKGTYGDLSVISGLRKNVQVLIYIDLAKALNEGLKFFESDNGVILTAGNNQGLLEPKYFLKAVEVSTGFPVYTQASDVVRAFTPFGSVNVESLTSKFAIVSFPSKDEAIAASRSTTPLSIYGQYLTVKLFTGKQVPNNVRQRPKKEFPKNTPKAVETVEMPKIDFSGDFHQQLDNVMSAIRLTQENIKALGALYTDVELAMQGQWPGCTAIPFGSITTGLGVKWSDADCYMNIPQEYRNGNPNFVQKAKRILQQYPDMFTDVLSIPRANTPIVKFFHVPTLTNCDLTFKTALGAQNSKLIAFLLHADPRLLPMAVLIKYWAKVQGFSGSGKLTNYALIMMVIFYMQQTSVGILPSVELLQRDEANDIIVDYWNTGFENRIEHLPPIKNKQTISELLGGFFVFYSTFNFAEMVICPFLGTSIKKDMFKDLEQLPAAFKRYKTNVENNHVMPIKFSTSICIQDPFEQCHNVASAVTVRMAADIKTHFEFARGIYEKEKTNNYLNFIKDLLLQKPKLVREKRHPDFRINLFPRFIMAITNPEWKYVIRTIVFKIFENMLKIKLGKVEEKLNPDSRKEKEKYICSLTKKIWNRKQYSQVYNKVGFQERQELITEKILNSDKETLNIQFQLMMIYCDDPKSSVISIRLGTGDVEAFREFGKFFTTDVYSWVIESLRRQNTPQDNNINCVKNVETLKVSETTDNRPHTVSSEDEAGDST